MATAEHALEPWVVAKGGRSVNCADGGKIRMEADRSAGRVQATMRLVSAAPDLLAECRSFLGVLEADGATCTCAPGDTCPLCRVRTAIAKATGKVTTAHG